ncbi:MAG: DUF3050 domain-containing protein, partial [Sphingobacteriales bacterium]|nr:DUF3050 domain-containing protein [Sphingobacteriales bacterium]
DADTHGPMGVTLLREICGNDPIKWTEVAKVAERSLKARDALWNGIAEALQESMFSHLHIEL